MSARFFSLVRMLWKTSVVLGAVDVFSDPSAACCHFHVATLSSFLGTLHNRKKPHMDDQDGAKAVREKREKELIKDRHRHPVWVTIVALSFVDLY